MKHLSHTEAVLAQNDDDSSLLRLSAEYPYTIEQGIAMVASDEGLYDPDKPVQHVSDIFENSGVVYVIHRQ